MKTKVIALLLVISLAAGLAGCGQSAIVGDWEGTGLLQLLEIETEAGLTERWTFSADGAAAVRLITAEGEPVFEQELRYAVTEDTLTLTREGYSIGVLYSVRLGVLTAGPERATLKRIR